MASKRGLGKGLDALFQSYESPLEEEAKDSLVEEISIDDIDPNRNQPRKDFEEEALHELSQSIKEHGVVQPIILSKLGRRYTIVAGERRWRAAKLAGLETIPAIARDFEEREIVEIALIENLQREDLNPLEESLGIKSYMDSFDLTQEEVGQRLGKSRSAIANSIRLLNLPLEIQTMISENKLTSGHGRAILGISDNKERIRIANLVIEKGLSVRELERLIREMGKEITSRKLKRENLPSFVYNLEDEMEKLLGTKVTIKHGKGKGTIGIEYYNEDDLDRIYNIIASKDD